MRDGIAATESAFSEQPPRAPRNPGARRSLIGNMQSMQDQREVAVYGQHSIRRAVGNATVTVTRHGHGLRTPEHSHPWGCIHYVLDGVYREVVGGASRALGAGEVLFKPPGERHWNDLGDAGSWSLRLEVSSGWEAAEGLPGRSVVVDDPAVGVLAERLVLVSSFEDRFSSIDAEALALELIDRIGGRARSADRRRSAMLVRRCCDLIEELDPEALGLGEAARLLDVHRSHLARVFRQETGCTLGHYQRSRRLRRALQRLRSGGGDGLADLAADAGYADQSHLTRSVKEAAGLPPSALRSLWHRGDSTSSVLSGRRSDATLVQDTPGPPLLG